MPVIQWGPKAFKALYKSNVILKSGQRPKAVICDQHISVKRVFQQRLTGIACVERQNVKKKQVASNVYTNPVL